jgi:hypothetical protein
LLENFVSLPISDLVRQRKERRGWRVNFFDKKGAEKVDSFIYFCFVSHGEKEYAIAVCMYGCMSVCTPACEREKDGGGGGNLGMKEELGGWVVGEEKQGIVEKVEELDI